MCEVLRMILVYVTGDGGYPNPGEAVILFSGSRLCRRFLSGVVGVVVGVVFVEFASELAREVRGRLALREGTGHRVVVV